MLGKGLGFVGAGIPFLAVGLAWKALRVEVQVVDLGGSHVFVVDLVALGGDDHVVEHHRGGDGGQSLLLLVCHGVLAGEVDQMGNVVVCVSELFLSLGRS